MKKAYILDFEKRLTELNEYIKFVEFIDNIETHKKEKILTDSGGKFYPNRELQKILRSNCFLLLYNLIESTVRNSILTVYDFIHDDSLKYEQLSERIQEIWLSHKTKQAQLTDKTLKNWLKSLMKSVSEDYQIVLDKESINISGNLDYDGIQKIINSYGFFGRFSADKNDIKNAFNKIKRERNLLAHGNKTFSQSGEIITMLELTQIKDNIAIYMEEFVNNIDSYIDNKKYKDN